MVISGALAIIATTASIFGLVNTGANVAGTIHDKAMINDSIANMRETQQLLQQKALSSSENQAEMMTSAAKLQQVADRMTELNNQAYTSSLRNEVAGLAKGLVAGVGGVGKLGEVVTNAVGIGETAADQVIGNKSLSDTLGNAPMENWSAAAQAGDALDVQILILQARQLAKRAKGLDKEMAELNSWYGNEQPGNTDSTQLDNQIAELVDTNPDLAQQLADTAVLADNNQAKPDSPQQANKTQDLVSDPKSGVGLDFLKDLNVHGQEIKINWTRADGDDSHYDAWRKHGYTYVAFIRQWDAFAHKETTNVRASLVINPDNSVSGTMAGVTLIGGSDTDINFELDGTFDPQTKEFNGIITGSMVGHSTDMKSITPQQYIKNWKEKRNWHDDVLSKCFTFHGTVDEENRKINGYFSFFHWRTMEGSY